MTTQGKESENGGYEFPYMKPKKNARTTWETIKTTIWDPSDQTFFGRTFLSWGQITLFYTIFYIVLAAMFAICMQGLFWSLDDHRPTWLLDQSLIGTNPGLGFRPISNRTEEGSLIWYDAKNKTSVQKWTALLDEFLELYLDSRKLPGGGKNQEICNFGKIPTEGNVCAVDDKSYGPCSRYHGYGYNNSSPCIYLKINRIYGWQPQYYNDSSALPANMPQDLKDYISNISNPDERNQIWISCNGENPSDREHLPTKFEYYPTRGFASYYYPYLNVEGYLSPLVAVQIIHPSKSILINIECRAWAKNIIYRGGNQQREGSVHLELLVD